jgi:hypothetical protein
MRVRGRWCCTIVSLAFAVMLLMLMPAVRGQPSKQVVPRDLSKEKPDFSSLFCFRFERRGHNTAIKNDNDRDGAHKI